MTFDEDTCYEVALQAAKTAGKMIKEAITRNKHVEMKTSHRDLVTETDKAVEDFLKETFSTKFPSHKFIGEETTASGMKHKLTDDPTWIIDPVDGTMNFVHTFPYTCVSIGLWVNKEPHVGIVYNPVLDQMFTARKDKGAFLNGTKLKVSGQTDISKSLVYTEMGTRADQKKMDIVFRNAQAIIAKAHGIRSMGSAALNQCYLAMGAIDAYYEIGIHAWDMAAGVLFVMEAGGVVMDVGGGPFNLLSRRLLCAASQELAHTLSNMLETYDEEYD